MPSLSYRFFFRVVAALFIAALAGCTTDDVSTLSPEAFVAKNATVSAPKSTKLSKGDLVEVSVEVDGVMEVTRHRMGVNDFGYVTLPLVGDVNVGGMTIEQARSVIARTYGAYYVNKPVIMLSRADAPEAGEYGYVTVMGRVGAPGRVALPDAEGINLTVAIQSAGGFAASAKQDAIRISRVEAGGKKIQVTVDFKDIGKGGNAESDVMLLSGDIVYVPERIF